MCFLQYSENKKYVKFCVFDLVIKLDSNCQGTYFTNLQNVYGINNDIVKVYKYLVIDAVIAIM